MIQSEAVKRTNLFRKRPKVHRQGPLLIHFMLGEDLYAIDMKWISKVEPDVEITPLPCVPSFISGLTHIGDQIITVVDLRHFMEVRGQEAESKSQIVVEVEGQQFSLLSDTIPGFITLDGQVQRIPETEFSILLGISMHEGNTVNIIDAEQLYWLLTGNMERIQNRLLRDMSRPDMEVPMPPPVASRPKEPVRIARAEPEVEPDEETPASSELLDCRVRVVKLSDLFATVLSAIAELAFHAEQFQSSLNAMTLRNRVMSCLNAPKPIHSLLKEFQAELGREHFEVLFKHILRNHLEIVR